MAWLYLAIAITAEVIASTALPAAQGFRNPLPSLVVVVGYVAAFYSTEDWVNFKLWGYAFPLVFIIGQGLYIAPHIKLKAPDDEAGGPGPAP